MKEIALGQVVAFSILMQNNEGIISKAPSYINEKMKLILAYSDPNVYMNLLDDNNLALFKQYFCQNACLQFPICGLYD